MANSSGSLVNRQVMSDCSLVMSVNKDSLVNTKPNKRDWSLDILDSSDYTTATMANTKSWESNSAMSDCNSVKWANSEAMSANRWCLSGCMKGS